MTAETLPVALARFDEVWAVDFEFIVEPGERPVPICCVARELRSGREVRKWGAELGPPLEIKATGIMVAYYASAEIGCFLALGWPLPANVLDLFTEFRVLVNGRERIVGANGASLLATLEFFGLSALDPDVKLGWRSRIIAGPPYDDQDRDGILEYCHSDVIALDALLCPLVDRLCARPFWLDHALLRGRYMKAAAMIEVDGTPIDLDCYRLMLKHWPAIKARLISETQAAYPFYEDGKLRMANLEIWAKQMSIPWPRTECGKLSLSEDSLKTLSNVHPELVPMRELRSNLGKMHVGDLAVGRDGRNRTLLSAFRAKTGRNQPSGARFIFAPSVWIRSLIRPPAGRALGYIDYSSQEIGIAAALSGDRAMLRAYQTGDPYLSFAIAAGLAPAGATKTSHKLVRDRCKALVLGTLYGMGVNTLASNLGISSFEAQHLLTAHRKVYSEFWDWSRRATDSAILNGYLDTVFGWRLHVTADTRPTSLLNYPMQSHGAEILRLACCYLVEAEITVCAPVHDAVLIEAAEADVDQIVAEARALMGKASRVVLGGFEVRTDAEVIRYPNRYDDPRGTAMWRKVAGMIADQERDHEPQGMDADGSSCAQIDNPDPIPSSLLIYTGSGT